MILPLAARAGDFGAALVEGQDWADWARHGWRDFIGPMNYATNRSDRYRPNLARPPGEDPSGVGRLWSAGELTTAEMIRQAGDALSLGAAGVAIFRFGALPEQDFAALRSFSRTAGG